MRAMGVLTLAAVLLASPALAQDPIATAPTAGPAMPQPTAPSPPLSAQGDASAQEPAMAMGPCGPEKVKPDGRLDTAPHGEVEAGVGTNGYRRLAGAVCQPIGQNGAVAVSISDTQGNGAYRRH